MEKHAAKNRNKKLDSLLSFFKRHKVILPIVLPLLGLLIVIFVHFIAPTISTCYNWLNYNFLTPNQIYLNLLYNQSRRIPIKSSIIYMDIKENAPIDMRFSLIQNNNDVPEISTIFINFPPDTKVEPMLADGRIWVKTNSPKNQYSIDYSDFRFTKGTYWDLPPLEVSFKKIESIDFEYSIIGNKMKKIERRVVINTAKGIAPDILERQAIDVKNTASAPEVE